MEILKPKMLTDGGPGATVRDGLLPINGGSTQTRMVPWNTLPMAVMAVIDEILECN